MVKNHMIQAGKSSIAVNVSNVYLSLSSLWFLFESDPFIGKSIIWSKSLHFGS